MTHCTAIYTLETLELIPYYRGSVVQADMVEGMRALCAALEDAHLCVTAHAIHLTDPPQVEADRDHLLDTTMVINGGYLIRKLQSHSLVC